MEQTGTSKEKTGSETLDQLQQLKSEVYHDNNDEIALGLGRPVTEIEAWLDGSESIDEDAEVKILKLAQERLGGDTSGPKAASDPNKSIEQRI